MCYGTDQINQWLDPTQAGVQVRHLRKSDRLVCGNRKWSLCQLKKGGEDCKCTKEQRTEVLTIEEGCAVVRNERNPVFLQQERKVRKMLYKAQGVPNSFRQETWKLSLNCHFLSFLVFQPGLCSSNLAIHFLFPRYYHSPSPPCSVGHFNSLLVATFCSQSFPTVIHSNLHQINYLEKSISSYQSLTPPEKPALNFIQLKLNILVCWFKVL